MTAGQINSELGRHERDHGELMDELIAAGRGNEQPSEYLTKTDPLSQKIRLTRERMAALRGDVVRRYGPGSPPRLPHGFGPIKRLSETTSERLDALEQRFAELMRHRSAMLTRLEKLKERPAIFAAAPKETMTNQNQQQSFRDRVDAFIGDNGLDVNKPSDRLEAARAVLRALQDAQEGDLPSPEDYLASLQAQTDIAQRGVAGAWGRVRPPKVTTRTGGGVQPGQPLTLAEADVAKHFAERLAPSAQRSSSDVHRLADELAATDPTVAAGYTSRAKIAALPHDLMGLFNAQLGKIEPGTKDRVGLAMRRAVEAAPRQYLPSYGWSRP